MNIKTHSKFFKLIKSKYKVLEEQPVPQQDPNAPVDFQNIPQDTQLPPEPPIEPEVEPLTSEGEVELIRLIRKALVINPEEGTIPDGLLDSKINEENAREILLQLKRFMNTYSDEPEI